MDTVKDPLLFADSNFPLREAPYKKESRQFSPFEFILAS